MTHNVDLARLPHLAELFKLFNNGKHLNRISDAALWLALEQENAAYTAVFQALGYELRTDGRGFAWFYTDDISTTMSHQSRQLALLFMVIFDVQADAGKALSRFSDWVIDRALLTTAVEHHLELLTAESLDVDGLWALLEKAESFGFARREAGHWQLLPAVCRYLDHFEALADQKRSEEAALNEEMP